MNSAVINTSKVLDTNKLIINDKYFCESCIMGKQTKKSHRTIERDYKYSRGEKIHTDVCGPVNIEERGIFYCLRMTVLAFGRFIS